MFCLAAAVSDFFVPEADLPENKIQSGANEGGLVLELKPVPKELGLLKREWCKDAFVGMMHELEILKRKMISGASSQCGFSDGGFL